MSLRTQHFIGMLNVWGSKLLCMKKTINYWALYKQLKNNCCVNRSVRETILMHSKKLKTNKFIVIFRH